MSSQMDLFHDQQPAAEPQAHARSSDPWTSHAAARSLDAPRLRATQTAVLALFHERGPMSHGALVNEYEAHCIKRGWPRQSESGLRTRTKELVAGGHLRDSGETVVLNSGRKSIVWEIA